MIQTKIEMEPKCKNCPYFELETNQSTVWVDGKEYQFEVAITCAKRNLCNFLESRIKEESKIL
jgi:hypothetical protein